MLIWMVYVVLVSLLLGLAALAFERSARLRKTNTRWFWCVSILASLLVPFAISSVSIQLPRLTSIENPRISTTTVVLRQMTMRELSPSDWLTDRTSQLASSPTIDDLLAKAWLAASAALLLARVNGKSLASSQSLRACCPAPTSRLNGSLRAARCIRASQLPLPRRQPQASPNESRAGSP